MLMSKVTKRSFKSFFFFPTPSNITSKRLLTLGIEEHVIGMKLGKRGRKLIDSEGDVWHGSPNKTKTQGVEFRGGEFFHECGTLRNIHTISMHHIQTPLISACRV